MPHVSIVTEAGLGAGGACREDVMVKAVNTGSESQGGSRLCCLTRTLVSGKLAAGVIQSMILLVGLLTFRA